MGGSMRKMNRWSWSLALLALLLVIACQGESPTAPTSNPGTGTPPPSGAAVTITVSNPTPLVSSTTVISAAVTQNGAPVPDGTAVEFETDLGTFSDTGTTKTIRTTTGGTATATLSSSTPGTATITVRVNNITKTATVAFQETPVTPPPPDTTVSITSIDPVSGPPAGGQVVRILGKNFREPLRVLFGTQEARLVSFTPTEIKVMTPAINLGPTAQAQEVDVTVIDEAGTTNEQRAISPQKFRYELEILTPAIFAVSPASGPNEGNTRITIFGEGFQAPVKVYFGTAGAAGGSLTDQIEVDVVSVSYNQIIAMTPPALGLGSELRDQQVTIRVQNLGSNKDAVLASAFRYGPLMQITSISPGQGPFTGGTKVTITGWGFDDPVAVTLGGAAAQVIRVSGTEIVAMTVPVDVTNCSAASTGPTTVTNIEDGASTLTGPEFLYVVPQPTILSVAPSSALPGSTVQVAVQNAFGSPRIDIGDTNAVIQSATTSGTVTTYTVVVPTTFVFDTASCSAGGTRNVTTVTDVTYTSVTSGCKNTFANGLNVTPPNTGIAFYTPTGFTSFTATYVAASAGPPATPATMTPSAPQTITVVNTGAGPLNITSVTQTGTGCANFAITQPAAPQTLNPCDSADITALYNPPVAGGPGQSASCTVTILTDAGTKILSLIGTTN